MEHSLTGTEQLMLEYINRARLDPVAEAARYQIDLNTDLDAGTLQGGSRQVLAGNAQLNASASAHSLWMLEADTFSHSGPDGSSAQQRMDTSGYDLTDTAICSENIAWYGTMGVLDLQYAVERHHMSLFRSASHRLNTLYDDFREVGVAQEQGSFASGYWTYDASMMTQDFAKTGEDVFLTGVIYDDTNANAFYSVGEGTGGVDITVTGAATQSADAGGYSLSMAPAKEVTVTVCDNDLTGILRVDMGQGNVKLDLVDGGTFLSSGSLNLVSGVSHATLLGLDDLALTGSQAENTLTGNAGDNAIYGGYADDQLFGMAGQDKLIGGRGKDLLEGGEGNDYLWGKSGADVLAGQAGDDRLIGQNGDDHMDGGAGDDRLRGSNGDDQMFGGIGDDSLEGGGGNDHLTGGEGLDRFIFKGSFGNDTIEDFDAAEVVKLRDSVAEVANFAGFVDALQIDGGDLVYDFGNDGVNTIRFVGLAPGDLTEENIYFG